MSNIPVIIMDPSTGHKNTSSSVSVLLNIAGVDANLHKCKQKKSNIICHKKSQDKQQQKQMNEIIL